MQIIKGSGSGGKSKSKERQAPPMRLIGGAEKQAKKNGGKAAGTQKKLSEFERYRKKLERDKKMRSVIGVTLLTAAVLVFVAGFGFFSSSEFGTSFRTMFVKSSQYPVELSGELVRQLEAARWNVVLLDESSLQIYNNKGLQTLSIEHGYATPIMKTSGERVLLYDQGGGRFVVTSPTRELFTGVSVSAVHAGDIAQNGTFAIATSSAKSSSEVKVYDEHGGEIFTWPSSDMVTSLAMSPDGKQVAVCLLGAENGRVVTRVTLLDLQNPKLVFKMDFPEEFGYDISFKQSSLCLITDRSIKSIDKSGRERGVFDYGGKQVVRFANGGLDHTVLVLGSARYLRMNEVIALDEKCKQLASIPVESELSRLRADSDGFYLMQNASIAQYSYSGALISKHVAPGVLQYLAIGGDLYTATYEQLQKQPMR